MKKLILAAGLMMCTVLAVAKPMRAVSPNGKLSLEQKDGGFVIRYGQATALDISKVGITTSTVGEGLTFQRMVKRGKVKADYQMKEGKRLHPLKVGIPSL